MCTDLPSLSMDVCPVLRVGVYLVFVVAFDAPHERAELATGQLPLHHPLQLLIDPQKRVRHKDTTGL